jgi:hypothetical protein
MAASRMRKMVAGQVIYKAEDRRFRVVSLP